MLKDLIALEPDSRAWIYPASRELTYDELDQMRPVLYSFLERWTAHNQSLVTYGDFFHKRFLCLFVDETSAGASGCSIDASVHFIQSIGQQLGIDFFDRQKIQFLIDDKIHVHDLHAIKRLSEEGIINGNTLYFNNLVNSKKAFLNSWIIPVKDGWLKRYI